MIPIDIVRIGPVPIELRNRAVAAVTPVPAARPLRLPPHRAPYPARQEERRSATGRRGSERRRHMLPVPLDTRARRERRRSPGRRASDAGEGCGAARGVDLYL